MVENDLKMRNKDINRKMHESNLQNQRNLKMQQVLDYPKPRLILFYIYIYRSCSNREKNNNTERDGNEISKSSKALILPSKTLRKKFETI